MQASRCAGSKIAILGVAYKKDVDDPRESPVFALDGTAWRSAAQC